jgi:hypothetical protein
MEMKKIEVNLGIGMNMFFPEPVKIVIEDEVTDEEPKKQGRKPKVKKEINIEKQ